MRYLLLLVYFFPFVLSAQSFEHLSVRGTSLNGKELTSAFAGGMNAPQFSEVDLDGNGIKDLYVFDRIGDTHLTFLQENTGDETEYRFEPRFAKNFPKCSEWILLRDYDNDGISDLFTYSGLELINGIRVFKGKYNNGKIDFDRVELDQSFDFNVLTYLTNNLLSEIFVSNIDYPNIEDVDGDGDLDILTYEPNGVYVQYFQNQAIEKNYPLDSLVFLLKDECWGRFSENASDGLINLGNNMDDCPDWSTTNIHPGSTLLTFDENGDGLPEILVGDNSNSNLTKLTNGGIKDTAFMIKKDTVFPNYDVPVTIDLFVVPFLLDVDNDQLKDLIVAPNWKGNSENYQVGWFYKNTGDPQNFVFEYQQSDWLVEDMFDFGSRSAPTFADVNGDGLLDMVIGNESFYVPDLKKDPRLVLLENIGTETEPNFKITNDNWLDFKQFDNYTTDFTPVFGDLDGDGDKDLLVGEKFGSLFFVENVGGAGNPMEFGNITHHYKDIDIGQYSAPQIADLNQDGLPDLLIGDRFGKLIFFPNIGTLNEPAFHPNKDEPPNNAKFGDISTAQPIMPNGHAVPFLVPLDSSFLLITGEESGKVDYYQFTSNQINDPILPTIPNWGNVNIGLYTKPALVDLNSDGILDLVVGNQRGGLSVFESHLTIDGITATNDISEESPFHLYPNPATDCIYVERKNDFRQVYKLSVLNVIGEVVIEAISPKVDISGLESGVYYIKIGTEVYKFIKI